MKQLTEYASSKAREPSQSDLMQSLFGIRNNQQQRALIANTLIEEAGITDEEVAKYIESRYADPSDIGDYGTSVFVYLYVREQVENLMWSELNRGFPASLITGGGFLDTDSRYELDKQDKEELLADLAMIQNRLQFVLWFIDQIKYADEPVYDYE